MKYNNKKEKAKQAPPAPKRGVMQNPYADKPKQSKKSAKRQASPSQQGRQSSPRHAKQNPAVVPINSNQRTVTPPVQAVPQGRDRYVSQNTSRHRKRHKKNYALYYILFFLLIAITGITLSLTVFFNVGEIVVDGKVTISVNEIKETTGVKIGDNMFRMSMETIEKRISDKYITIEDVNVSRKFPATLKVTVSMATPKASITYDKQQYTLSAKNRIINVGENSLNPSLPRVVGISLKDVKAGDMLETVITEENTPTEKDVKPDNISFYKLSSLDSVLKAIEENKMEVSVIDLTDTMAIRLYISDQYEIKLGGISNAEYKLHCAKSIIDEELADQTNKGTIDVSVDNGMYYFRPAEKITIP